MSKKSLRRLACGLAIALAGTGSGCGDKGPQTVSVSGEIKYKGAPVQSGSLTFAPKEKGGAGGTAYITAGEYRTPAGKGLLAGEYKVVVTSLPDVTKAKSPGEEDTASLVPTKYTQMKTTDLELSVPAGETSVTKDFELVD